jgi:hypothetical protein
MKTFYFILFTAFFINVSSAHAVCQKCEEIREYNKQHPEKNYDYYDDYLKAQGNQEPSKNQNNNSNGTNSNSNTNTNNANKPNDKTGTQGKI